MLNVKAFYLLKILKNIPKLTKNYSYTTGQNCGTTYKNCIKNMVVFKSGYLREKLS